VRAQPVAALIADTLDVGAKAGELRFHAFVAAVDVITLRWKMRWKTLGNLDESRYHPVVADSLT